MEEDYMSDAFLKQLEDVRPGLKTENQKRRERASEKVVPSNPKKRKVVENEAREQALDTPLSADNKGFSLLQKMGYKEGMGLGKSGLS